MSLLPQPVRSRQHPDTPAKTAPFAQTNSEQMKVFKLDDCDYVAAYTLLDAIGYYRKLTGVTADSDDAPESDLSETFKNGEIGSDAPMISFLDAIAAHREQGGSFPSVMCTDGHYC